MIEKKKRTLYRSKQKITNSFIEKGENICRTTLHRQHPLNLDKKFFPQVIVTLLLQTKPEQN